MHPLPLIALLAADPDALDALQAQMESLIADFASTALFREPPADPSDPPVTPFLPVTAWPGVNFFAVARRTRIKSIEWKREAFGGSIDFSKVPDSVVTLYVEDCALQGSLDAAALPRSVRVLMLRGNYLDGTIAWGALPPQLTVMDVEHNAFSGSVDLSAVPRGLYSLKLRGNRFSRIVGRGGDRLVLSGIPQSMLRQSEVHPADFSHSLSPHPDSLELTDVRGDDSYHERPSARRDLLPEFGASQEDSTWDDSYQTEDFSTESSMSQAHLSLSHSYSAHSAAFGDYTHSYSAPLDDSELYGDMSQQHGFEPDYQPHELPSLDVSSIMANDVDEFEEMEKIAAGRAPRPKRQESQSGVLGGLANGVRAVLGLIGRIVSGFLRFLLIPVTQPYPSSADFANY